MFIILIHYNSYKLSSSQLFKLGIHFSYSKFIGYLSFKNLRHIYIILHSTHISKSSSVHVHLFRQDVTSYKN